LKNFRILLIPLGIFYGLVMAMRNKLFDLGILSSQNYLIRSIGVGNLSIGGTGKSVLVMYLINMLRKTHRIAILSRGYGRKSSGLIVAGAQDNVSRIGDEPFQFFNRYPETTVVVSEKRTIGMRAIGTLDNPPELVIMDDMMQHRWVQPHIMIMTTSFDIPYFEDFLLPAGSLREFRSGVKRADILLITRTPDDLSIEKKEAYLKNINIKIPVFFTKIKYSNLLTFKNKTIDSRILNEDCFILVTGIADTRHLVSYLKNQFGKFDHIKFSDHHNYSDSDSRMIQERAGDKIILTTEKDIAKLTQNIDSDRLCCLKIELDFVFEEDQNLFDKMMKNF